MPRTPPVPARTRCWSRVGGRTTICTTCQVITSVQPQSNVLLSAPVSHCTVIPLEHGEVRRLYSGQVNHTERGEVCLNWREVNETVDYSLLEEDWLLGDHNYCRNPNMEEEREFCYVNKTQTALCAVKSCGKSKTSHP